MKDPALGVMQAAPFGMVMTRSAQRDFRVSHVNPAFTSLTGYSDTDAMDRNLRFLQGRGSRGAALDRLRSDLRVAMPSTVVLLNYRADGRPFHNLLLVRSLVDGNLDSALIGGLFRWNHRPELPPDGYRIGPTGAMTHDIAGPIERDARSDLAAAFRLFSAFHLVLKSVLR